MFNPPPFMVSRMLSKGVRGARVAGAAGLRRTGVAVAAGTLAADGFTAGGAGRRARHPGGNGRSQHNAHKRLHGSLVNVLMLNAIDGYDQRFP